jgi:DNA-binding beta-propeller fold protein YncE
MQKIPRVAIALGCIVLGSFIASVVRAQEAAEQEYAESHVFTFAQGLEGAASAMTLDVMGNLYVANFGEVVYKVKPNGKAVIFASGLYGTTGNAIDSLGNLYQASFYGGYITKITRHGNQELFAKGLAGPMALAFGAKGALYVSNCSSQSISRITSEGTVSTFADGALFKCPNGITLASDGNFYVVNFDDESLIRITAHGEATKFATLPYGRNTIASARGHLYVASLHRRIYRVSLMTGEVTHLAGTGERRTEDGPALEASFARPNGIAVTPDGSRVYVNSFVHNSSPTEPQFQEPDSLLVRLITLPSLTDRLTNASHGGERLDLDAMAAEYHRLRANPATAGLLDEAEMTGFAREIQRGAPEAAIKVLELNAESYPRSWRVFDALAEAHLKAGHKNKAITFFKKSLLLNPENVNAADKLKRLRGGA